MLIKVTVVASCVPLTDFVCPLVSALNPLNYRVMEHSTRVLENTLHLLTSGGNFVEIDIYLVQRGLKKKYSTIFRFFSVTLSTLYL